MRFLNAIEAELPPAKMVHVILDNYAAHKHPKVRAWLDRHERFVFHFHAILMVLAQCVEGFFARLSRRRLKARLSLRRRPPSVINRFLGETNAAPCRSHGRRPRQNHRRRQTRAPSVEFHSMGNLPSGRDSEQRRRALT